MSARNEIITQLISGMYPVHEKTAEIWVDALETELEAKVRSEVNENKFCVSHALVLQQQNGRTQEVDDMITDAIRIKEFLETGK